MKTKLLILFLSICFFAKAQITVTSADMPLQGDTVRYSSSATNVSSMLNDTGANKVWDFSNLVPNFQNIDTFARPSNTVSRYALTFGSSTFGKHDPDLNLTLVTASKVYTFYTNSSASLVADGRGLSSTLPSTQTYTGKDVIYKFPLNYGNSDSSNYVSTSATLITTLGSVSIVTTGKRKNITDGWGSITTPYGTFDCIRVKSIVQQTDTVKITTPFAISLPVSHNQTQYKWIAKGKKIPVLEIDVTTGITSTTIIKYLDGIRADAFRGNAKFTVNKTLFAVNSSSDTCILTNTSLNNPKSVQWTITPNTFQYEGGTSSTSSTAKIYFTAAGTYSVSLRAVYGSGISDTTRTNFIIVAQGPTAKFSSSINGIINPIVPVYFYDSSTGTPNITAWKWTFVPNKVSFVGGTSSTSKNPIITFDSVTNYAVTLKVNDPIGSNSITKNINVFSTGIIDSKLLDKPVTIYPNPAENYFEMTVNINEFDHIDIYDVTGKLLQLNYQWKDQNICVVDCSGLNAGVYFVKIYLNTKQTSLNKIIVR